MTAAFEGVFSVLPTPFDSSGDLDIESLRRVIDLVIGAGVNGVTALGVTSEVTRLTERERGVIVDVAMAHVNARVPVVVGTSADGTNQCIDFSRVARDAGASAVMVSPPRMPTLNSDAVMRHFISLAEAVDLPIIIQDYPVISGYSMEPALLARIAREVPTARTIKMEDPPTPLKVARTLKAGEGIDLTILGGLGGVYLLEELISGASGTMTGFAYPEILVKVVHLFRNGDVEGAADTFYRFVPLMRFEFQEGIGMAIRKEMLRRRGVLSYAAVRPPGASLDEHTTLALDRLLHWIREKEKALWISV